VKQRDRAAIGAGLNDLEDEVDEAFEEERREAERFDQWCEEAEMQELAWCDENPIEDFVEEHKLHKGAMQH